MNVLMAAVLLQAAASSAPYVIAVGVNQPSQSSLAPLRYADDDAANAAALFGATPERTWLLTSADGATQEVHAALMGQAREPTRGQLFAATQEAVRRMTQEREEGGSPVMLLWLVGHGVVPPGEEGALVMADGLLTARELREEILAPLSRVAHRVHLVVDACHAAALIRARAMAAPADPMEAREHFTALDSVPFGNVGTLLSAAADQKSYEWDQVRGGVFSALVRSALRGLADADLDGRITYVELAAFVTAAVEAVPNPEARPRIQSRPPAVDLNAPLAQRTWFGQSIRVRVNEGGWGRFSVEDQAGELVAAANLEPGFEPELWAPRARVLTATTQRGKFTWIEREDGFYLAPSNAPEPAARGSVDEALGQGLLRVAFGPGYHRGFRAALTAQPGGGKTPSATGKDEGVPMRRLLILAAFPPWSASLLMVGLGAVSALVAAQGFYAWNATNLELPALAGLARGAGGSAVGLLAVATAVALVVAGGAMVALALR